MENQPDNLGLFVTVQFIICTGFILLSLKWYGLKRTLRFFLPVMIGAFALEISGILSGKYTYSGYPFSLTFGKHEIPLIIILGWSGNFFLLFHLAKFAIIQIFKKNNWIQMILIGGCTGLFGICLDLLEDPVAHHNRWWIWQRGISRFEFYGVPFLNFLGWFVFIFYLALSFLIIDKIKFSENRKLLIAIASLPMTGFFMLITQIALRTVFQVLRIH